MEQRQAKLIDLEDWEKFGGGGNGWSYNHKHDSSIIMKLNKKEISEEISYREFLTSKTLHEMGINCPKVLDFVTDGIRFGMTIERIQDKQSYVKMIADNPDLLEPLAKDFAVQSKKFHSIKCDITLFDSNTERFRRLFASCPRFTDSDKKMLDGCLDALEDVQCPIHGDFTPSNIIRSDGKDYWIDLGNFSYGDPDMDLDSLNFIAKYTPAKVVEYIFHITRKQFKQFLEIYGREYYGDRWGSKELKKKIDSITMIRVARTIAERPRASIIYLPLLHHQRFKFAIILKLADIFVRRFN
ncbi:MAG: phosphotransferase [Bacteroidales bacterium]|nr:phosphotransferase [Candidatus Colimorpha onthohippi]